MLLDDKMVDVTSSGAVSEENLTLENNTKQIDDNNYPSQNATKKQKHYHDYANSTKEWVTSRNEEIVKSRNGIDRANKFPKKLHQMLEFTEMYINEYYIDGIGNICPSEIVRWDNHGRSFTIVDRNLLVEYLFPIFFPYQTEYSSFQRQLNLYGFSRLLQQDVHKEESNAEKRESTFKKVPKSVRYYHEMFMRSRSDFCSLISRCYLHGTRPKNAFNRNAPEPDFDTYPSMPTMKFTSTHTPLELHELIQIRDKTLSLNDIRIQSCNQLVNESIKTGSPQNACVASMAEHLQESSIPYTFSQYMENERKRDMNSAYQFQRQTASNIQSQLPNEKDQNESSHIIQAQLNRIHQASISHIGVNYEIMSTHNDTQNQHSNLPVFKQNHRSADEIEPTHAISNSHISCAIGQTQQLYSTMLSYNNQTNTMNVHHQIPVQLDSSYISSSQNQQLPASYVRSLDSAQNNGVVGSNFTDSIRYIESILPPSSAFGEVNGTKKVQMNSHQGILSENFVASSRRDTTISSLPTLCCNLNEKIIPRHPIQGAVHSEKPQMWFENGNGNRIQLKTVVQESCNAATRNETKLVNMDQSNQTIHDENDRYNKRKTAKAYCQATSNEVNNNDVIQYESDDPDLTSFLEDVYW